ncbi:MAG: hypothetical protein HZA01_06490 [Nitrospinae bacterium]|nr:hypothetical protein [Nitrospinota bacterium]
MSYILDSLKKLEQEKQEQSRHSDLKSVLLKTEHSEKEIAELRGRIKILLAFSLAFCVVAVILGVSYYLRHGENTSTGDKGEKAGLAAKAGETLEIKETPNPEKDNSFSLKEEAAPLTSYEYRFIDAGEDTAAIQTPEKTESADHAGEPLLPLKAVPSPDKMPVPTTAQRQRTGEIVNTMFSELFEIKTIIFFGEGDPENYIIIQDETNDRAKLRKGEKYMEAELVEILPQKARFTLEGSFIDKEIGKEE